MKKGDMVFYKNIGYGVVSYEGPDMVIRKRGNRLYTQAFDKQGLKWDGRTWVFDGGLGLVTYVVSFDDIPPNERAALEEK